MTVLDDRIELEQIGRENSRSINSMRFLFLALNDVAAFEREVLETGNKSSQDPQLMQNLQSSSRPHFDSGFA